MRRPLLAALALCCVLAGCGASTAPSGQVAAWDLAAPYLPPPDPSVWSAARPAAAPAAAKASTARAATRRSTGAQTDAQVARELREAFGSATGADVDRAAIGADGLAIVPPSAPSRLVALMRGANEVAHKPYVYGGGHGRNPDEIWSDSAYDCSGSVSYALAAAGYLDGPMVSGALASWGKPGPGRWVTIYANAGHTFMVVAGLRFDTSGRTGDTGSRWQAADARSYAGFTVRHPVGL